MSTMAAAVVLASEGGEQASPWLFGLAGFGVLVFLLIVTLMINVDR